MSSPSRNPAAVCANCPYCDLNQTPGFPGKYQCRYSPDDLRGQRTMVALSDWCGKHPDLFRPDPGVPVVEAEPIV